MKLAVQRGISTLFYRGATFSCDDGGPQPSWKSAVMPYSIELAFRDVETTMKQYFDEASRTWVSVDEFGRRRALLHTESVAARGQSPEQAAVDYLREEARLYGITPEQISNVFGKPDGLIPNAADTEYRLRTVKTTMDIATVDIVQTMRGVVVWRAGAAVQVLVVPKTLVPIGILSSTFTGVSEFQLVEPNRDLLRALLDISPAELAVLLGLEQVRAKLRTVRLLEPKINLTRPRVYRYSEAERFATRADLRDAPHHKLPHLPVGPIPDNIREGADYAVAEVLFTLELVPWGKLNWSALIDPDTRGVLYLRALVDNAKGLVFKNDPQTLSVDPDIGPRSDGATLDAFRELVELEGLTPPLNGIQRLEGEWVKLEDCYAPEVPAPSDSQSAGFSFGSRTDEFGAVNAYYHCDGLFRMLEGMGFDVRAYFDGTRFPIPIDHRASIDPDGVFGGIADNDGNKVNAQSLGNELGTGQGALLFLLADAADVGNPLGAAVDRRVVQHEFGHTLLWDHVHDCNFGFAHGAGDTIAAVLGDVAGPPALERGVTIPFTHQSLILELRRRHDRQVGLGWAWGGREDDTCYGSEQILTTTLFNVYRAIGGDHPELARREAAARTVVYLVVRAIGTLTPASRAAHALDFANALMTADAGDWVFEGLAGGAYHKVIRWAFERQGLYQLEGSEQHVRHPGASPAVDIYIEDGRNGDYPFPTTAAGGDPVEVWNRTSVGGDGDGAHEEPILGAMNQAYVRIRTRGTQRATNIVVRGFHSRSGGADVYPEDWLPMVTSQISVRDLELTQPPDSVVAGPFDWTPAVVGEQTLLFSVSALGDPSNIDGRVTGSIGAERLVLNDNNLAVRRVTVLPQP